MKPTIFALASAPGRAGVSVIRLSGPQALETVKALTGNLPEPRRAVLRHIRFQEEVIDQALVLTFPAPASFTGEDCVELHVHGSPAVLDRIYTVLRELGLRLAEPGEFSRRAFENGKLDLTQAEAIADLVDAESDAQRRQALRQLDGGLQAQYADWRERLTHILARTEVLIDFPDENIPDEVAGTVLSAIAALEAELTEALKDANKGRQIREGYRIAILGKPNAGKSSLFNALLQTDAAIVTAIAGTTRDVLESSLHLGAYQALLYDTAGLRETEDLVEAEGIRRARKRAETTDLRLWVIDGSEAHAGLDPNSQSDDWVILNKQDSADPNVFSGHMTALGEQGLRVFATSLSAGRGAEILRNALEERLQTELSLSHFPAATRERHLERLSAAREALVSAQGIGFRVPELMAEDLRRAIGAFDAIFGRQDVERILDHIFSSFCIGK